MDAKKWISVHKRKPVQKKQVLVYAPDCDIIGSTLIGIYFKAANGYKSSWTVYDFGGSKLNENVTHWMPLPKKPK